MDEREYIENQLEVPEALTLDLPSTGLHSAVDTEVVVAGYIGLDITPALLGNITTLAPGHLLKVGKATLAPGGPVSNTGLALHKLGITTHLMGKLGDDLFGQMLLKLISAQEEALTSGMIISSGESSSYSILLNPLQAEHMTIYAPGANDTFSAADVRYDLLDRIGLFHFGYPPQMRRMYQENGVELTCIFEQVKAQGVTTSLDLCMPDAASAAGKAEWEGILAAVLPHVDVFLPGVAELLFMLRRPLYDKLANKANSSHALIDLVPPNIITELGKQLLDMGAKVVVLRAGHRGLYLCTAGADILEGLGRAQPVRLTSWAHRELWVPCFTTEVISARGAGDATVAGFLMGFLRGMSPEETLSAACAVGACSVETADAVSGILSWPETMERIASGWSRLLPEGKKRSPLDMNAAGWRWNERYELWIGALDTHY